MKRILGTIMVGLMVVGFSACGGGGSGAVTGTDTSALEVAERISVVDADSSGSGNIGAPQIVKSLFVDFKAASDLGADTDYNTDETSSFVNERSAESFMRINAILCSLQQAHYDTMVNQGPYQALIDTDQCSEDRDSAEGAGASSQDQSTGSSATSYETWVVDSSRLAGQPHIVKAWMHESASDHEPGMLVYLYIEITEGVSASNPIGIFTSSVTGCLLEDTACSAPVMSGYVKTEESGSDILLKFYMTGSMGEGMSFSQKATLNRNADGTAGSGSSNISDTDTFKGAFTDAFDFAFDSGHFFRSDGTTEVCLDRNNYSTNVWRYGVYYDERAATPGARVERNGGFPIKATVNSGEVYGFAGYYGVYLPAGSISNGDTVYKQDWSAQVDGEPTQTPYTVFVADGRLKRHDRQEMTLGNLKDIPLAYNVCEQVDGEKSCYDQRVIWDGTSLKTNGSRSQATSFMWQDETETPFVLPSSAFSFNFRSDSLGGEGRVNRMNPATGQFIAASSFTDATPVIFYTDETVYPGDTTVPDSFACFENCPDPTTLDTINPSFALSTNMGGNEGFSIADMGVAPSALVAGTNYIEYTFDDSMVLQYSGSPVVQSTNEVQRFGARSGALVDLSDPTVLEGLQCPWTSNCTSVWQAQGNLETFYTWETGVDEWNKLTALRDGTGAYVTFDPPLMLKYENAEHAYFYLNYNGLGDLWGIPGKCVDGDTGEDTECFKGEGDESHTRWVSEFSLAAGTAVTDVSSGSTYYIKPLNQEQQMLQDPDGCSALTLTTYPDPAANEVTAATFEAEPAVGAPKVIGGVIQE